MHKIFKNLKYFPSLIPSFYIDDFLSEHTLDKFDSHWPKFDTLQEVHATPGARECPLVTLDGFCEASFSNSAQAKTDRDFWESFICGQNEEIKLAIMNELRPYFLKKYKAKDLELSTTNYIGLRTVNKKIYKGLEKHVHYYHDPIWLFTYFIYLDDDPHGLTLYKYRVPAGATHDEIRDRNIFLASPSFKGDRKKHLEEDCKLEFKRNRLVVMLNSSISWHGVSAALGGTFEPNWLGRRHLVGHLMLPRVLISGYFGFDESEWSDKHLSNLPKIYSNLVNDVDHSLRVCL